MFWWFFSDVFLVYKGCKSSLRDSISMWSPRGKNGHIRRDETMKTESQRLDL